MIDKVIEAIRFTDDMNEDTRHGTLYADIKIGVHIEYADDENSDDMKKDIKKMLINNILITLANLGCKVQEELDDGRTTNVGEQTRPREN